MSAESLIFTAPTLLFATLRSSKYDYRKTLKEIGKRISSLKKVILLDDLCGSYTSARSTALFADYSDISRPGHHVAETWRNLEKNLPDSDIVNLQFTSGSTGAPKAAALTHHGTLNSAFSIGHKMGMTSQDKVIVPVPFFHAFGLIIGRRLTSSLG